jgi:thioesterase domain-containing protein/acyl carrier protein
MNERGAVLVEVESFSMRRVTSAAALVSAETPATVRAASAAHQPAGTGGERAAQSTIPRTYYSGILPAEGMDALGRVLGAGALTRVLVSPVDLTALIRSIDSAVEAATAPAVKVSRPEMSTAYAGADDEVETALVEIWESLLGVDNIGVNDDFFDLGGHSLIAVRLFNRVKATFDVDLGLAVLFEAPTIAKLASLIRASGVVTQASSDHGASEESSASVVRRTSLVPIQSAGSAPPIFCVHGMYGNVLNFREIARRLGTDQPFYGLQAHGLDGRDLPHDRIEHMAEHYIREIRQVQPSGPLLLCGYSGGGLIAFEMARQLRAAGDEVALLVMLDTFCPATIPADSLEWRPLPSLGERGREVVRGIVTGGVPYLTDWLRGVTTRLTRSGRRRAEAPLMEEEGTGGTVDIGEHFRRAQGAYMLTPTDVRLTIIKAATRLERWPIPDDLGWEAYAAAGVEVLSVPGSHFTMLTEPNVTALARTLRQAIARTARPEAAQSAAMHGGTVPETGPSWVR